MAQILEKLIILTIEEVEMYPSIQAKIWGSIGQVPELIDMVLDNFIQRSVSSGKFSQKNFIHVLCKQLFKHFFLQAWGRLW